MSCSSFINIFLDFYQSAFDSWPIVVQIITIILTMIGGTALVPVINSLKETLGLTGRGAMFLTYSASGLLALMSLIANGAVSPEPFSTEYLVGLFSIVLAATQVEYRRLEKLIAKQRAEVTEELSNETDI